MQSLTNTNIGNVSSFLDLLWETDLCQLFFPTGAQTPAWRRIIIAQFSSLYTFPKKDLHSAVKNYKLLKTREERMQSLSPDGFGFVVILFVCFSKKTWKFDCGVQRSRKVADWAFTRLSEDFKRVLDVSPRKCHKPVHCFFIVLPVRENARNLFIVVFIVLSFG